MPLRTLLFLWGFLSILEVFFLELVLLSGISGAGKSQAMKTLEDLGYYTVDNLPPFLLKELDGIAGSVSKAAISVDARSRSMISDFPKLLPELKQRYSSLRLLFLDAADDVILRRYKEDRRRHPLLEGSVTTIEQALTLERELLVPVRQLADFVIDTSLMPTAQLKSQITQLFAGNPNHAMVIQCVSFGFKNGLPPEADLVFDVRCLPNPFYIPELREHTGLEHCVQEYVLQWPESREFRDRLFQMLDLLIPLYVREGKTRLVIAFGCTGGKHRSVTFAETVGAYLRAQDYSVIFLHRDLNRP
jgi:UPF0042 nucleotide-binding protein